MQRPPRPEQIEHSEKLVTIIKQSLENQNGWMPFDQYMNHALYEPYLGYYSSAKHKFGEQGDFITAPLMGDLFAKCLARQCQQVFQKIQNEPKVIVEFGAGTGQLAFDILLQLHEEKQTPSQYLIIETSADLKQRQRETLCHLPVGFFDKINWLDELPTQQFNGVVIANEVLDAFPVKRFCVKSNGLVHELGITYSDDRFIWQTAQQPISEQIQQRLQSYDLPLGYESEWHPLIKPWLKSVSTNLVQGVILLIDYGFSAHEYYHADRTKGTLMCHYQHQSHSDPFFFPGLQDITSHVNFSLIKQATLESDLQLLGYCSQAHFLLSLGLLDMVAENHEVSEKQILLNQQIKKLTLPHEMGELFKVIAVGKGYEYNLDGFTMKNNIGRL